MTLRSSMAAASLAAAIVAMGSTATANVTFGPSGWVDEGGNTIADPAFIASINDIAGGVSFSTTLSPESTQLGDILLIGLKGFAFTADMFPALGTAVSNTADTITAICVGVVSDCGGPTPGGGFTGGLFQNFAFDAVIKIGAPGTASGFNTDISFNILAAGLTSLDFTHVGLRLHGVGVPPDDEGSLKIINDKPSVIPLPAAGWMLLMGIGGLAAARRMKKAA